MNISDYFTPLKPAAIPFDKDSFMPTIGLKIDAYWEGGAFPEWEQTKLAIVGVCEGRNSEKNPATQKAPDAIRSKLYSLAIPNNDFQCADLGNIQAGATPDDTQFALTEVLYHLMEKGITVVILGGSQALSLAQYRAYEVLGKIINIVSIDSQFDIENREEVSSRSWVNNIILMQPNFLFNFAYLGYQTYLNGNAKIDLIDELQFDALRLGDLRNENVSKTEPYIRAADMVSVDVSALRQGDAPGNANASPHGFMGEELCTMMRYSGMSDRVTSIGFYEANPEYDMHDQTVSLIAQACWHFLEAFSNRFDDCPYNDDTNYKRFRVALNQGDTEIVFYKSRRTDRWWFEIPCPDEMRARYQRNLLIPCTYADYEEAVNNEIPKRWWRFYQRMNMY